MVEIKASVVSLVIGAGILLASLLADVIGLGDDVGFGPQQTIGTAVGLIVIGIGVYLRKKESKDAD